jgi:DNA-binding NarL/FixJ family response regulator
MTESPKPSSAKVFIVDDHPIVRRGLTQLLADESDLEVCGEAPDGSVALRLLDETRPDVIIVDLSLERGIGGIELIKEIRARNEGMKILVSSMHDEKLFAERCLNAGAMGYVNKQEAPEKIVTAIRRVLAGKVYVSEEMSERFLARMVQGEDLRERTSAIDSLSDRELEVFELIGRGETTRQIAQDLHLSVKTIETYRENIKAKLSLANTNELMQHAVKWVLDAK